MFELSDDPQQPSLSDRLQEAAVRRAEVRGDVVDDVVLDDDGVLDLREPLAETLGRATEPAAALTSILGSYEQPDGIVDLYAADEPGSSWWQRGRAQRDTDAVTSSSPTLSAVPLSEEATSLPEPVIEAALPDPEPKAEVGPDTGFAVVSDDGETVIVAAPTTEPAEIDLTDGTDESTRPLGQCRNCGGVGRRDLFDRFNQMDYYSCDECSAMWQEPHT